MPAATTTAALERSSTASFTFNLKALLRRRKMCLPANLVHGVVVVCGFSIVAVTAAIS